MVVGVWQLVLILLVVMILFGAGKLPHVVSDIGKSIVSLRKAFADGKSEEDSCDSKEEKSI